jgi:FAD:protein FMN transferase
MAMEHARASFEAIGVSNRVAVARRDALDAALAIAREDVAALDLACSRFRNDSELVRLNRSGGRAVRVSPLLLDALRVALAAAEETGGLVDPTVGPALSALGYDRDFAVVVASPEPPSFRVVPASGWRSVELDAARSLVRLRRGTELDLGATAKAFAADRIAARIERETGSAALVSLGGDVAVSGAPDGGWPVRVTENSRDPGGPGQTVAIASGGLATSSTTVRRWRAGQVGMHHIIDPATGVPALEHWRSVSVAAPSCAVANTAATAAVLKGAAALPWLDSLGLPARLVHVDGSVARSASWPDEPTARSQPRPRAVAGAAATVPA